ncbi:MAG TPA: flagellar hook protein FlgE [Vicinamibacterales bacterium]|nr:flagellar hook protein FlgE [Vicinamibacterales bacterium]
MGSFSAALSGLNANEAALNVIGNNLANINTVGYKTSTVNFSDLVSQTVGGSSFDPMQVGLGVATSAISPSFSQGAPENTQTPTNAAIQGNGFFVLKNSSGGLEYSRAGDFTFDNNGTLVAPDGSTVQGYTGLTSSGTINTSGQPTDITVSPGALQPPSATTSFTATTNLNATATAGNTYTSSVQVYDALGTPHVMTITYTNAGAGVWNYAVTLPGAEVTGGTAGTPYAIPAADNGTGQVVFGANGTLSTVKAGTGAAAPPADFTITTPTWSDGSAASSIQWNILDSNGNPTLTGYNATSATSSVNQNGSAPGQVSGVTIAPDGTITATFGAGQTVPVGQLALANFNNPNGLTKLGGTAFGQTQASGVANIGVAGTGGLGTITGSALEQSNVNMATEFTNMILAQAGYEANAKSITTGDQILQDTLMLVR